MSQLMYMEHMLEILKIELFNFNFNFNFKTWVNC